MSSLGRGSISFAPEDESLLAERQQHHAEHDGEDWPALRRRRSSITNQLSALTEIGGVNSIRSFARSWQRAAGFVEVIPQRPSFVFAPDQEPIAGLGHRESIQYGRSDVEAPQPHARTSLLRQHFEASTPVPEHAIASDAGSPSPGASGGAQQHGTDYFRERALERKSIDDGDLTRSFRVGSGTHRSSIFAVPPHLATPPLMGSYGSYQSYGTIDSGADEGTRPSMAQAGVLWRQQQEAGVNVPDGELAPILVKEVEEDGKIILTVEGQSTLPQTIFNATNVLIGVGLLSLPMGIKYAGWICGIICLFLCAAVTSWTARLLARCMDLDPIVITFSDLAYISYGARARLATSVLFTLELLAACVALIVLFADSLDLLLPGVLSVTEWKILCSIIMIPLNFLPLRFLSFTSIIGIVCCFGIVTIILIDGFVKQTTPGSLIEPATTYLFPANWLTLPLSFGLLMSPWGGHSVFPNIYRDMRHPHKFGRAVTITFSFTFLLDAITAVAGILMFGDGVLDEITSNILAESSYPRALTYLLCALIAIIPLTKIPLNARPIITTAEVLTGLHQQAVATENVVGGNALVGRSMYFRGIAKVVVRIVIVLLFLVISIVFPAFDSIMAFMGSALCFTICVTLPLLFYLKLFGHEMTPSEKLLQYTVLTISITLSTIGTVWAFLPRELLIPDA